jgi:hypothetical protein
LKILWIDDEMKKTVKFSFSLGRIDIAGTEINTNTPEIISAKKDLEMRLYSLYRELYK